MNVWRACAWNQSRNIYELCVLPAEWKGYHRMAWNLLPCLYWLGQRIILLCSNCSIWSMQIDLNSVECDMSIRPLVMQAGGSDFNYRTLCERNVSKTRQHQPKNHYLLKKNKASCFREVIHAYFPTFCYHSVLFISLRTQFILIVWCSKH